MGPEGAELFIGTVPSDSTWSERTLQVSIVSLSFFLTHYSRVDLQVSIWSTIESRYPWIQKGGHSQPENCLAQHRVAIIVPYRCREEHLKIFLNNLHDFGHRQQLDFMIMVVEPIANQTFNRAKLLNIGSLEALKMYPWECFVFHDVDLLPEDDRILYSCPVRPRHMSVAIDIYNYT